MVNNAANLLIIEDEPITRSQLAAHVEKEGYNVFTKDNAADVEKLINDEGIELCLIDINLPGKDGLA